jgi:hypothetical protein
MGRTVLVLFSLSLVPLLSSHGGRGKGREEEALIKKNSRTLAERDLYHGSQNNN